MFPVSPAPFQGMTYWFCADSRIFHLRIKGGGPVISFPCPSQVRGNEKVRQKKICTYLNTVSCVSVISRVWITSLPQIERGVSCSLVENHRGWREVRNKALLEVLLSNAPSLSRALSRDDPMILCRFPQISSDDQGGWLVIFFPRPSQVRGNGRVRQKKKAAFTSTQYHVSLSSNFKWWAYLSILKIGNKHNKRP